MKKRTNKQLILLFLCLGYATIGQAQDWYPASTNQLYARDGSTGYTNINVGIRTDNPNHALDVVGDIYATGTGIISATGPITTNQYYMLGGGRFIQGPPTCTYLGTLAGLSHIPGATGNTFMGLSAGQNNIASENTFIGRNNGNNNTTGGSNTFIGSFTGYYNTTGSYNVAVGAATGAVVPTWGDFNTFVGFDAKSNGALTNATAIGAQARVNVSNAVILGNNLAKVGIGTSSPLNTVHIKRIADAGYALFSDARTPQWGTCRWDNAAFAVGDDLALAITVLNNKVGTGCEDGTLETTFCVYGNGSIWAHGDWITSDARYKKNVKAIPDALSVVKQLQGKKYDYNMDPKATTGEPSYGFIAQEMEKVIPELVKTNDKGYKAVNYDGVIPFLVESIKEQQKIIEETKAEIADLQQKLANSSSTGINNQTGNKINTAASLEQNAPNPFSNSTSIKYHITGETKTASIIVFDMNGTQIKRYELPIEKNGELIIQGNELRPGMYLYTLMTDGREVDTKRMIMTSGN